MQTRSRNRLHLWQQSLANYQHPGTRVVEKVLVIMRLQQRVHGNGDSANFDRAEEAVSKFWRIQQEQYYPFFRPDFQTFQKIAAEIHALQKLVITDLLLSSLNSNILSPAFNNVAVNKVGGNVEFCGKCKLGRHP